ncbi:uncharacterized protein FIBRA_03115 [Fibroporia radiculosa]|uniref:F-box domain-containing protein n=1 Tax=Fibroporia radiculosa TaxID=599839 RepID=J4HVT4_9APHY|nr:uncharacterized protein FIBRA_03115 [Fibroporia radiculosa]CCM01067.1 predicted protein [Fibroporia radiculosa]
MSSLPATTHLRLDTRYDESVLGSEVERGEMYCANRDGGDDEAESLGSMSNTAPLDADVSLGHSIQLPIELWEKVIDYLVDDWEDVFWYDDTYEAMVRSLGRVCWGWHGRCHFRGLERLDVRRMDKKEVFCLINTLNHDPERCYAIKTVSFDLWRTSTGILGTFAVCMAQKLSRVKRLILLECEWEPRQLHAQVFVHITLAFESVTVLELKYVRFPSAAVFGRLVRALPRLLSLQCWHVSFDKHGYVAGRIWELHPLRLDVAELVDSDDVADFLMLIGAQLRHLSWRAWTFDECSELLSVTAESLSSMHIDLAHFPLRERFPPDFPIDLTLAVNLRDLSISSDFEDLDSAAKILSPALLPKLAEITIISTLGYTKTLSLSINQNKLDQVDKDPYALLDQAFSSPQYPALKKVVFELHCAPRPSEVMEVISEVSWGSHLSPNLPALHTSGRLVARSYPRPFVSVRVEELA